MGEWVRCSVHQWSCCCTHVHACAHARLCAQPCAALAASSSARAVVAGKAHRCRGIELHAPPPLVVRIQPLQHIAQPAGGRASASAAAGSAGSRPSTPRQGGRPSTPRTRASMQQRPGARRPACLASSTTRWVGAWCAGGVSGFWWRGAQLAPPLLSHHLHGTSPLLWRSLGAGSACTSRRVPPPSPPPPPPPTGDKSAAAAQLRSEQRLHFTLHPEDSRPHGSTGGLFPASMGAGELAGAGARLQAAWQQHVCRCCALLCAAVWGT